MAERKYKTDWETDALERVASRVESVTSTRAASGPPAMDVEAELVSDDDYGWEESVLRRLRSRLFGDGSTG